MPERREDRHRQQRAAEPEPQQHRPAPDAIRYEAEQRLQRHVQQQRERADPGRRFLVQADRVDQVLLHIDGVRIERDGAADRDADREQQFAPVRREIGRHARLRRARPACDECIALDDVAAHVQREQRQHAADEERNPPRPALDVVRAGEDPLHRQHQPERDELARDHAHLQEADVEAAPVRRCDLAQVGRAGAVLAAHAEALQEPRGDEQRRREHADRRVAGRDGDQHRARAHREHRFRQRGLAPVPVRVQADEPASRRPRDVADRRDRRGIHQLHGRPVGGKERRREIDREDAVCEEVVPLDQVAGEPADDRADARRRIARPGWGSCHGCLLFVLFRAAGKRPPACRPYGCPAA